MHQARVPKILIISSDTGGGHRSAAAAIVAGVQKFWEGDSHAVDEPTIQAETDRYIAGPGQACSYKLGQLKIRELRERAKQQLGAKFDLKTFHDQILSGHEPLPDDTRK